MPQADFQMPVDVHGRWAQALAPGPTLNLAINGASNSDLIPTANSTKTDDFLSADRIVRVTATADCYIEFGTSGVTATSSSLLFLQGTEMMKVPSGCNRVAGISKSGSAAQLSITVMR